MRATARTLVYTVGLLVLPLLGGTAFAQTPALSMTPSTAGSGTTLAVTGTGFDPNSQVDVQWAASDANGSQTASPTASLGIVQADGTGSVNATVPALVANDALTDLSAAQPPALPGLTCPTSITSETVQGIEQVTSSNLQVPTSVAQSVYFSPWLAFLSGAGGYSLGGTSATQYYPVAAGATVKLGGCLFTPGQIFTLTWPGVSNMTGTVGGDGSLRATVNVPANATRSTGTVTVTDGTRSASLPLLIFQPTIGLSASTVASGGSFTVSGGGLTPGATLAVAGFGVSPTVGTLGHAPTATVAGDGTYGVTWTLPSAQATGSYYVEVIASDGEQVQTPAAGPYLIVGTGSGGGTDTPSFSQAPSTVTAGASFSVKVSLLGHSSQVDTSNADTIRLSLVPPNGGAGSLGGTTTVSALAGVASFNVAVSGGSGSGYELEATDTTSGSIAAVDSGAFSVTAAPQPDTLSFGTLPSSVLGGGQFAVTVALKNSQGQTDTAASETIRLAANAPSGQSVVLSGTSLEQATAGVASFSVALSGGSGAGFTLTASDTSSTVVTSVTSGAITVIVPNPAQDTLQFTLQPPASLQFNQPLSVTVSAISPATRQVDNTSSDQVSLSLVSPAGFPGIPNGTMGLPLQGGVATFNLSIVEGNGAGYALTATDTTRSTVTAVTSRSFSLPFTAVPTSAAISFPTQPPSVSLLGESFGATVAGEVYDQLGNPFSQQQIGYSVLDPSGNALSIVCGDGSTASTCVTPLVQGQATVGATAYSGGQRSYATSADSGFTLWVTGWANNTSVGQAVASQAFTLLDPSPLVVSSASTAYTSTGGVWGIAQPPYAHPGSLAGVPLPFLFAGVQFSLPYTQGTHVYLAGDTPTSPLCVDGTWQLNLSGGAGSNVTASVYGSGCQTPVDLASLSLPAGTYGGQLVLTAPQGATGYGTDDVVLYGPLAAGRSTCDCWPLSSLLDTYQPVQLQISQASALAVGATAQLPVQVVSAPLPVDGIHAEASWDPTALAVQIGAPSGSGIGYGNRVPGHWGFLTQDNAYVHAAGAGQPVLQLTATCLQPGTWPLTLSGSWWHYEVIARSGYTSQISQPFSFTGHVACAAPPAGATSVPGGAQVNPADGTLSVSVTGSGLSAATQAVLLDASGNTAASALSVTPGVGGTSAAAHFPATPGGIYTLQVKDTSGNVLAGSAGVDVPPALPYFTVAEGDALPQVPGFHETHFWRVTNTGDVNGVAVLLFVFPAFVTPEPTLHLAALPAGSSILEHDTTLSGVVGSWAEIVSVPIQAGQAVDVPWTVTLDPNSIFGANAPLAAGDTLPVIVARLGMVTTAQAQSLGLLSGPATGYGKQLAATSNTNLVQALSGVAALTGGSAASYETFLQSAAPSLAAQLYSGGLLSTVADLNDSVQAGVVSLTHGSSAAPQGGR